MEQYNNTRSSTTTANNNQPQKVYGTRKVGLGTSKGLYYVQVKRTVGSRDHYLSRKDVVEEMGVGVAEWCDQRPDVLLTNRKALRWSLTDQDDVSDEVDDQEWTLKAIKLVRMDEQKVKRRHEKEEEYFGLDFDTNRWWPIKFCTMVDISLQDPVSVMDYSNCKLVYHPRQRSIAIRMDAIDDWCMENCGKPYLLHRPGSRSSTKIPPSLRAGFPVFCRSYNNGCMIGSLCNLLHAAGFDELCDDAIGLTPSNGEGFRRIGSLADKFCQINGTFRFPHQRMTIADLHSISSGLFLVRLRGSRGVDHCICLDGNRKAIIDSFSSEAIKLTTEGLQVCVGDRSVLEGVLEVCKFHITSVSIERKRNRTSSHRRHDKRKRERGGMSSQNPN